MANRPEIADIKKDLQGLKLNTIAEIYKANLTVASFADHERRIEALERKLPLGEAQSLPNRLRPGGVGRWRGFRRGLELVRILG